ncbi:MAG TPA: cytochrome d ubiquinol oxidase subunit II [Mycobacteriales bacterium]
MSDAIAVVLFVGVVLYTLFGGADFGAGFWDLTAGGAARGREARTLLDRALGPVWEANHVWLIYCLVVMWTAFPPAFAAIMSTLYLPLGLAAFGIVLRGSGFAFRKMLVGTAEQPAAGAVFAVSSVVTPFFLGAVAGAVASGRVPGDALGSWLTPTSVLAGTLAVAVCAYLAATNLTVEARLRRQPALERYFRRRARLAAVVAGALSLAGLAVVRADAPRLGDRLLGAALPLVLASAGLGLAALVLLRHAVPPRPAQVLAAAAVGALAAGWGVAQYPYLLGTHLTVRAAASPYPTLVAVAVVFGAAVLLCVPSLALLYVLEQRGELEESPGA